MKPICKVLVTTALITLALPAFAQDVGTLSPSADIGAAGLFQKLHHFRGAVMPVTAHRNRNSRPVLPNAPDHVAQHLSRFLSGRTFAGPQHKAHRLL